MTDYEQTAPSDAGEIDLTELFARIKPSIIPALIVGGLCAIAAFFYTQTVERVYVARAQYIIEEDAGGSLPSLGGLVSTIIPSGSGSGETDLAADRIMSREFITSLFDETGIDKDPFFTRGKSNALLSWFKSDEKTSEEELEAVIETYREVVSLVPAENGLINLYVSHSDRVIAASIANMIMEAHIANIENKRKVSSARQVELVRERLLLAQEQLDKALEEARVYAVENSVGSQEQLIASSLNLTRFRRELTRLDSVLAGVDYIATQRAADSNSELDLDDFFTKFPLAFAPLRRDFGWTTNTGTLAFPSSSRLLDARQNLLNERDQLLRTIRVMEKEATQNADAAGTQAELQRNIEVQKSIYTAMVSQFEARDLSAVLQDENVERIQDATPPLKPSLPRVLRIVVLSFILGSLAVLLINFLRSWGNDRLYSSNSLRKILPLPVQATNIGRSVGTRLQSASQIAQKSKKLRNVGLLDLIATLRDEPGTVSIVGLSGLAAPHNMAVILGNALAAGNGKNSVALVDLSGLNDSSSPTTFQDVGILDKAKGASDVQTFDWTQKGPQEKRQPFGEAIASLKKTYTQVVIICAPLQVGLAQNRVAMKHADRLLVVAAVNKSTVQAAELANKLRARVPQTQADLIFV